MTFRFRDSHGAVRCALTQFDRGQVTPEHLIDCIRYVRMNRESVLVLDLYEYVERGRSLAFEHGLLCAAPARFFVGQSNGLNAADEIRQRRIDHQIFERVAMDRCDQLDSTFRYGASGEGFLRCADFIDDDHFRHVILHRFDHHRMLMFRIGHLHPSRTSDSRVRNVSVAGDFI